MTQPKAYLERHQGPPLKHIALKCQTQHGLLVYHKMGTGKTRTILALTYEYPDYQWIVVLPDGLQQNWASEIKKANQEGEALGLGRVPVKPTFVDYSDTSLQTLFKPGNRITKDTIVVLEEAHNFVTFFNKDDNNRRYKIAEQLKDAKKVIALTGTPVYNKLSDMRILVNLVAGKEILPADEQAFLKQYYQVNVETSIIQGWLAPLINQNYMAIVPFLMTQGRDNPALLAVAAPVMLMAYLKERLDMNAYDYHVPIVSKLHDKIRPYVSFYAPEPPPVDKDSPNRGVDFPEVVIHPEMVPYTPAQVDLWLTLCQNFATPEQRAALGYDTSVATSEDIEEYLSRGRVIGNLTIGGAPPPKFAKVKAAIGSARRVVIYSNFVKEGLEAIKEYLGTGYHFAYMTPDQTLAQREKMLNDFRDNKIQILLLHPSLIEGISILGATQIHVLEPPMTMGATEQVVARVVRWKSHEHLKDAKERKVDVFHWISVPNAYTGRFQQVLQEAKLWASNSIFSFFTKMPAGFPSKVSPEGYIRNRAERSRRFLTELEAMFMRDSIDRDAFNTVGELQTEKRTGMKIAANKPFSAEEQLYLSLSDMINGIEETQTAKPVACPACPVLPTRRSSNKSKRPRAQTIVSRRSVSRRRSRIRPRRSSRRRSQRGGNRKRTRSRSRRKSRRSSLRRR